MRIRTIVLSFVLLASCHGHRGGSGPDPIPVFVESERNDHPLNANDFGVLRPGDRFFIDGFVRDDSLDPFDGFAFTAAVPLHVDFQLFIGNASADLDVCLYDPQIDETVACFATSDDPERGGVDVFAGGLAFQLVVESFVGDASYSLEIDVQPLSAASVVDAGPAHAAARLAGVDARAEHELRAEYGQRSGERAALTIEQELTIDERTGLVLELVRVRRPDTR